MDFEEAKVKFHTSELRAPQRGQPALGDRPAIEAQPGVTLLQIRRRIPVDVRVDSVRTEFGALSFKSFFDKVFETSPIYKQLVVIACNSGIFTVEGTNLNVPKVLQLLALGRLGKAGVLPSRSADRAAHYQALALAEGFGPYTPAEWRLNTARAQREIILSVLWLMSEEGEGLLGLERVDWFDPDVLGITEEDLEHAERLDIHQALILLEGMAVAMPSNQHWLNGVSFISTALTSICRRGIITDEHRQRMIESIREATSSGNVHLPPRTIERFYRFYGHGVKATNARKLMKHYNNMIPENIIPLRNLIIQAAGSGLTTYMTIIRAMATYKDFDWPRIRELAPADYIAFEIAMDTIQDNVYFGFNAQMGVASARNFPTLAYCSFQLCIRAGGDMPLREYRGQPKVVPFKPGIDAIINDYIERRAGAVEEIVVSAAAVARTGATLALAERAFAGLVEPDNFESDSESEAAGPSGSGGSRASGSNSNDA
uniref:Putative nucleoprotein n=1 Tax=Atrato Chu-like virus 1 TaxID=2689322 RepID=A0A6B9KPD4_9VIRU|nr:putative nucleoprotein [Atrato Chu-like virus 1]QHA33919.1 putative nucleoprotein [Atrato Chu-like virus 1]